ncbi:MAG: hypothetical protein V3573_12095 [Desulfovibrionaceae bacterium]
MEPILLLKQSGKKLPSPRQLRAWGFTVSEAMLHPADMNAKDQNTLEKDLNKTQQSHVEKKTRSAYTSYDRAEDILPAFSRNAHLLHTPGLPAGAGETEHAFCTVDRKVRKE